mgnify:FL=1|jgi:hypothetical protein
MVFTLGQNVNVTINSVTTSGKISKLNPLGSKGACIVEFADGTKKGFFGTNISQIVAA